MSRGKRFALVQRLRTAWSGPGTDRARVLAWCGRTGGLLVVLATLLWWATGPGSAFAQVPWDLAAWMPGPSPTATPPGQASRQPAVPDDLPANVRAFVLLALPYALQANGALGWQTSVILAQWGLEHGWQVPDAQGYNWGNTEYAPGCSRPGRFCYAPTPSEGLREYIYTASLSFYDGVRAAVVRGADATAVALGESPWDEGHYGGAAHPGSSLLAILRAFNLYRLDLAQRVAP
jgi:hypothetical protein